MDHREMSSRNRVQAQTTYSPVPLISSIISVEKYMVYGHDSTGRRVRLWHIEANQRTGKQSFLNCSYDRRD